jgi:DNA-binding ferritin-like protein
MNITNVVFPFTVPSEDRKIPLRQRMELAAIFSLAELSRDKGGGLISKKPAEETLFISRIHYPLWFIPWKRRTLVFDGFDMKSYTLSFDILPDANIFVQEMRGSSGRLETYSAFLSHNLDYFKKAYGRGQKVIKGLIMDPDLMNDLFSLFKKAKPMKNPKERVLLPLLMDQSAVEASMRELQNFERILEADARKLGRIVKMLVRTTQRHVNSVKAGIEKIKRRSDVKIKNLTSRMNKKTEKTRRIYDEKIVRVSRDAYQRIQLLSQEEAELKTDRDHLRAYIEQCKKEISAAQERKDERQAEYWRQELRTSRRKFLEIGKRLKEIEKEIKDIGSTRDFEISRLKSEYSSKAEGYMAEVRKLEAACEAKIKISLEALETLERLTSQIVGQINGLIEARTLALKNLREMGYPIHKRKSALAYMPFFLVCYGRNLKRRYLAFPPSIANTMNGVNKIKSALRPYTVRSFLQEYSLPVANLLNEFVNSIQQNSMLEDRIFKMCMKSNLLKQKPLKRDIEKGLTELAVEGWLSEEELQALQSRLEASAR